MGAKYDVTVEIEAKSYDVNSEHECDVKVGGNNHWTGKQALAVVEFLDEISAAVWTVHEINMLDAWHEKYAKESVPDADEIPPDQISDTSPKTRNADDDFPF